MAFNILLKKTRVNIKPLSVDIHSHLIPGIDDGVHDLNESLEVIKLLQSLGYSKLITTPHIIKGQYNNTPEIIRNGLQKVKDHLNKHNLHIELEAAAEYYYDESFVSLINSTNKEKLLLISGKYILLETSFLDEPRGLHETVLTLRSNEITPILAHPERYMYINKNPSRIRELKEMGLLIQVNINSFSNYYGTAIKSMANKMIKYGMVDFLGSDCHGITHGMLLKKSIQKKSFEQALSLRLLNNEL